MRWLRQNIRQRVVFALKNPRYALTAMIRELTLADERFLAQITATSPHQIRKYMDEPINTPDFANHIRGARELFRTLSVESADLFAKKILNQYAAVRALAPDTVIETGIANGVSSAYLLLALQKNGKGCLHSIGLADPAFLPSGRHLGWLVPEWLRAAWQIHEGDARETLPQLLTQVRTIGIFIHDSHHSYDHMMWEFETAYPKLQHRGLLVSDDVLWNNSFYDFARKTGEGEAQILHGVGFLRKNSLCGDRSELSR
jgi:predicted O-methyltransferase YrrM